MGWLWSSNTQSTPNSPSSSAPSTSTPSTSTSTSPLPRTSTPTMPSHPDPDPEAAFQSAYPHLAPSSATHPQAESVSEEYPTTMSCRTAFDSAFYCSSLGSRFNDIYRHGALRSCSEHWSDFWFCMRIKSKPTALRRELVVERYREKEERVRQGANSEDVWKRRREGERRFGAFARVVEGDVVEGDGDGQRAK